MPSRGDPGGDRVAGSRPLPGLHPELERATRRRTNSRTERAEDLQGGRSDPESRDGSRGAVMISCVRELRIVYAPSETVGPLLSVGRPSDAALVLCERIEHEPVEVCIVLLLNTKH